MTLVTELHVQGGLWVDHGWRIPVLYMEGEAPDQANGALMADALYAVVRARGLRLTTDPDHLFLRPVPGWRIEVDERGAITVRWPHFTPLLAAAPVKLPDGWREAAADLGVVVLFAGYGLGLHDHHADGNGHAITRLSEAAMAGTLASGAVTLAGAEDRAARLDGTIARPRRQARHHAVAGAGQLRQQPLRRWWSGRLHGKHR